MGFNSTEFNNNSKLIELEFHNSNKTKTECEVDFRANLSFED